MQWAGAEGRASSDGEVESPAALYSGHIVCPQVWTRAEHHDHTYPQCLFAQAGVFRLVVARVVHGVMK